LDGAVELLPKNEATESDAAHSDFDIVSRAIEQLEIEDVACGGWPEERAASVINACQPLAIRCSSDLLELDFKR
jgi:hypothetical protein